MVSTRAIGMLGTTIRLIVGVLLVGVALTFDRPSGGVTWWDAAAVLVVLPLAALGAVVVLNAFYRRWPWLAHRARTPWSSAQAAAAVAVIAAVLALGTALTFLSPVDRVALWIFFGTSMILAAVRGDDGCEILAIPNTILRRTDAIWCPIYTQLDTSENPASAGEGELS